MNTHPTIVHAAADLHRNALLTEAADDWRTMPTSVRANHAGPGKACRRIAARIAAVVSRVIDDFEPRSVPIPPHAGPLASAGVDVSLTRGRSTLLVERRALHGELPVGADDPLWRIGGAGHGPSQNARTG